MKYSVINEELIKFIEKKNDFFVWAYSGSGDQLYFGEKFQELFIGAKGEVPDSPEEWSKYIKQEKREKFLEFFTERDKNYSAIEYDGIFSAQHTDFSRLHLKARKITGAEDLLIFGVCYEKSTQDEINEYLTYIDKIDIFLGNLKKISSYSTSNEFLASVLDIIRAICDSDFVSIMYYEKERKGFSLFKEGSVIDSSNAENFVPFHETVVSEAVEKGKPVYRPDITAWPLKYKYDDIVMSMGIRSDYFIPLISNGECIATLDVAFTEKDGLTRVIRVLIESLVPNIVRGIENSTLIESIKASEERYRTLQENIPVGVYRSTPQGQLLTANRYMFKMFGYTDEEHFLSLHADKLYAYSEDRFKFLKEIQTNGKVENFNVLLKRKDNSTFTASITSRAVINEEGDIIHIDGILEDIDQQVKAEQEAREKQKLSGILLDSLPGIALLIDRNKQILLANKNAKERGADFGRYCWQSIFDTEFVDKQLSEKSQRYGSNQLKDVHCHFCMAEEALRTMSEKKISDVKYDDKYYEIIWKPVNEDTLLLYLQDITERRRHDEESLRMEKLEALGILAGGIAHDFNNMLASLLANISLAKIRLPEENEIAKNLHEAEKAIEQARGLTTQLLAFSRGGTPIIKLERIGTILKEMSTFVLRGSNVQPVFEIEDDLWSAKVDKNQIGQVFQNVVLNALQSMPDGGKIRISARNIIKSDDGNKEKRFIEIKISDKGKGVSPEEAAKIFDPYFTTRTSGSGLGLTVSHKIIKNHDGFINFNSEKDKGSMVTIVLPASRKEADSFEQGRYDIKGGKARILLMDDDANIRKALSELLRTLGYDTVDVSEGQEAIDAYKQQNKSPEPFDIIILDLTVPGKMGGREALEKLLKIDPSVTAIATSGYSNDEVMSNHRKFGFAGVLPKPFTIEMIDRTLTEILESNKE